MFVGWTLEHLEIDPNFHRKKYLQRKGLFLYKLTRLSNLQQYQYGLHSRSSNGITKKPLYCVYFWPAASSVYISLIMTTARSIRWSSFVLSCMIFFSIGRWKLSQSWWYIEYRARGIWLSTSMGVKTRQDYRHRCLLPMTVILFKSPVSSLISEPLQTHC